MITQALLDGLLMAAIYLPLALGLTLIFGVLGVVNFAHAEILVVLLYVSFWLYNFGVPMGPLVVLMMIIAAAAGLLLHIGLVRPLLPKSHDAHIVITLGLSILIQSSLLLSLSSTPRTVATGYSARAFEFAGVTIRWSYLIAALAGLIFALVLDWLMSSTSLGARLRATAHDRQMASLMGIDTERIALIATILGIVGLGLASATMLPVVVIDPTIGHRYIIPIFSIVILAGLGSTRGVFIGAVLYALLESISAVTLPIALANMVPLLAIALVLIIRPTGLMGGRQVLAGGS